MNSMVVYSSKTGNTKKIAEAIYEILPEPAAIFPVESAPAPDDYDFIAMGFWVDKGTADQAAMNYMKSIKGKKIGLFMTLGAYPDSEHAAGSMANAKEYVADNEILGDFICQGKVDPRLVSWMEKNQGDHPHAMNPERKARLEEAAKHPNEQDCRKAQERFRDIIAAI